MSFGACGFGLGCRCLGFRAWGLGWWVLGVVCGSLGLGGRVWGLGAGFVCLLFCSMFYFFSGGLRSGCRGVLELRLWGFEFEVIGLWVTTGYRALGLQSAIQGLGFP